MTDGKEMKGWQSTVDAPERTPLSERIRERYNRTCEEKGVCDCGADDPPCTEIASWADEVAALEQERKELLTLRVERCAVCGEPSPTFCDEHSPSLARLRDAIREIADAAEMHSTHVDDDWCAVSAICVRALTEGEK